SAEVVHVGRALMPAKAAPRKYTPSDFLSFQDSCHSEVPVTPRFVIPSTLFLARGICCPIPPACSLVLNLPARNAPRSQATPRRRKELLRRRDEILADFHSLRCDVQP